MTSTFERWTEPFDPNETKPYTYRFKLPPGVSMTSATVTIVDENDADVGSDLAATSVSFGLISGTVGPASTVWGVTWYPSGGSVAPVTVPPTADKEYRCRCRYIRNDTPIAEHLDRTMILVCKHR